MIDCSECYRYEACLIESTSIAIMAAKEGMKASCYKFIHKNNNGQLAEETVGEGE